jgi:hypothetical protein
VNQGARYLPTGLQHPGGADRSLVFRVSDKLSGGAPIAKDLSSGSESLGRKVENMENPKKC